MNDIYKKYIMNEENNIIRVHYIIKFFFCFRTVSQKLLDCFISRQ